MTRPFSSNPTSSCKGSSKALRVDSWDVKDDDPDYQEAHDAFLKAHNSAVKTTETGEWNCLQEQRRARQLWGVRENRLHLLESSGATVSEHTHHPKAFEPYDDDGTPVYETPPQVKPKPTSSVWTRFASSVGLRVD